jgi:hypothetical protein
MDTMRADDRLNSYKKDSETTRSHNDTANNFRYEKLKASNDITQETTRNFYDSSAKQMQEGYDSKLDDLRLNNKEEQSKIFDTFGKQSAENDKKYQEKLNNISVGYERHIAELEQKHTTDLKTLKSESDRRLKEQVKKDKSDMASQTSQADYRISKLEETHQREMHEAQRRHQEALANLTKNKQG